MTKEQRAKLAREYWTKNRRRLNTYHREYMRRFRAKKLESSVMGKKRLSRGHCPSCWISLEPEYQKYHKGCSYFENIYAQKRDKIIK